MLIPPCLIRVNVSHNEHDERKAALMLTVMTVIDDLRAQVRKCLSTKEVSIVPASSPPVSNSGKIPAAPRKSSKKPASKKDSAKRKK